MVGTRDLPSFLNKHHWKLIYFLLYKVQTKLFKEVSIDKGSDKDQFSFEPGKRLLRKYDKENFEDLGWDRFNHTL